MSQIQETHPYAAPTLAPHSNEQPGLKRQPTSESTSTDVEKAELKTSPVVDKPIVENEETPSEKASRERYQKLRPFILAGTALLIFAWWVSSLMLMRHRWIVSSLFSWFFILVIIFRFVPSSIVSRPIEAVWTPVVATPWNALSYPIRLGIGFLCLLAVIFGSAFGFKPFGGSTYGDRAISVAGLFVFQFGFYLTSRNRSAIPWPTVIVGLFLQQVVAMFVLKTGAGFAIFKWIATLAGDFLNQGLVGGEFFFDKEVIGKHWFFVNTLSSIIFFVAFVQMMYYLGVMQWLISKFAWFFFKIMNVSGAEAVVAAASPFIGQGESACLVLPYVDLMTESEIHVTMTSGFSTIAGSVLGAYISMGVPPENLVTASVMSIPASIAISKMRLPETEEPVTRGRVVVDRGKEQKNPPANALHAFCKGAVFGLIVAGQILTNLLTVLALVATINGLLTWIGHGFGIHQLTLQLVLGYIFYPVTFFLGVPRNEILTVSRYFATKLVANEFVAYLNLRDMQKIAPLSHRGYTILTYGLCGFANLGSVGIQIGVLGALAPSRGRVIARLAFSAMICGFLSTLQTAGIAGMLV